MRCRKAHIAGTQAQYAIRQLQALQQLLHVLHHFFQYGIRLIRTADLYQFYFVKLVEAIQAPRTSLP